MEGRSEILFSNSVNLETSAKFLEQLGASDPAAEHVVIWDGAGFHPRDGNPTLPANVRIVTLPPYSPELNPVEKLWDQVKDAICNQLHGTLPVLEEAIQAALKPFKTRPACSRSSEQAGFTFKQTLRRGALYLYSLLTGMRCN